MSNSLEAFIERWQGREGGQERANYALFLTELCEVIGLPHPDPASATTDQNDYVFERVVKEPNGDGTFVLRRIDLYKRGCFVLEAKQSRQRGGSKPLEGQTELFSPPEPKMRGRRTAGRAWDVLMMNARQQAQNYARALPTSHGWPPFLLVCDVGHCIEVYADFSGQGKNYAQFPDRQGFRIYLEDLERPEVRQRLLGIWTDPWSLDPARVSARVTRGIAERLAAVSRALEAVKHPPETVAMFLMRCLFTMFAEDVGLLPEKSFRDVLAKCEAEPEKFAPMVGQLWQAMDKGGFAYAIEAEVKRFNGEFFQDRTVLHLGKEEIGELRQAASADWRDVEPAIFGALLEQALDPAERKRLGAHYTPRAYVERLVVPTIIEPLRADWAQVLSTAERQKAEGRDADAVKSVRSFHEKLCITRVLDPACGTGNFLYVSLELLKRLEGEVLEALVDLGGQEALSSLEGHTVDPHQFLGIEINPRAAAIAELVLWIGYLQWHFRTKASAPAEPILRAFKNIQEMDAVLSATKELARDAKGKPQKRVTADGEAREVYVYKNPKRPEWPLAEFIVGNPPFIGGKDLRACLENGDAEAEALWAAHPHINESADFVMYWWDHAAEILTRKGTVLRRFGLVTTNSISQVFQRRVMERHFNARHPITLVMAIPDHPWTKATRDAAAVRIAMTVATAGRGEGVLREVVREAGLETDQPTVELSDHYGKINSNLTIGVDVTSVSGLRANEGLCSRGMSLHGAGFIVTKQQTELLGLGKRPGLERHIREYRNGKDVTGKARGVMVIDLLGLEAEQVRKRFPEVYQRILTTVKPERELNNRAQYRDTWWVFGEPRRELRPALLNLHRFIATVETAKHRYSTFLSGKILPDNRLICFALDDAYHLGIISSHFHIVWALACGGTLEDRPIYTKSRCFDPFPFPAATEPQSALIRTIAEDLDAHRKQRQAEHPGLTLTEMYNVLERLRAGASPSDLDADEKRIFDDGLILILKELHDRLDGAVAAAYGWPADLVDEEILTRLVALNKERAAEESRGLVRWVRPDYQIPRFATAGEKAEQLEVALVAVEARKPKPAFPAEDIAQTAAVMAVLADAAGGLDATVISGRFRQGKRIEPKARAVLLALTRMGFLSTQDGGKSFLLRRAS